METTRSSPISAGSPTTRASRTRCPPFGAWRRCPSSSSCFCGEWDSLEYEAQARPLIEKHGLTSVVTLPGPVTGQAKQDVLSRAWVLVVPSHSEGQPWVIIEAMSAGIPVVATDTGAIAETIADGVSGFVVPVGDPRSPRRPRHHLLQDDGLWKKHVPRAADRYQEHFTVERATPPWPTCSAE